MAILGGGPGGPVGSSNSFTGTANALEIVGNHISGLSGLSNFDNNAAELINFETGSYYCVLQFIPTRSDTDSADSQCRVYFNDTIVLVMPTSSGSATTNIGQPTRLIVPAYTQLKVDQLNVSNTSNLTGGIAITGELYR